VTASIQHLEEEICQTAEYGLLCFPGCRSGCILQQPLPERLARVQRLQYLRKSASPCSHIQYMPLMQHALKPVSAGADKYAAQQLQTTHAARCIVRSMSTSTCLHDRHATTVRVTSLSMLAAADRSQGPPLAG